MLVHIQVLGQQIVFTLAGYPVMYVITIMLFFLILSFVSFCLLKLVPGDPVRSILRVDDVAEQHKRQKFFGNGLKHASSHPSPGSADSIHFGWLPSYVHNWVTSQSEYYLLTQDLDVN
jgi:ABC-type dipeptide/oligopeptide/nickel transport system permease component